MPARTLNRRRFLRRSAALASLPLVTADLFAKDGRPVVTNPRATSGDQRFEPNWEQRLTISVGPKSADLRGQTDRVIQAAIDYVARLGGGTVRILPGRYLLRNSVFLASNVRLIGSGADTVLTKGPSITTQLAADSDWYDQEITLKDGTGFQIGDGICLTTKRPGGGTDVLKRTLVARSGNRFKLDRPLRKNYWLSRESTAATLFPLLTSEYTNQVVIESLTLDGNRAKNDNLNGNYGGCIFLQDCNRYVIRDVTASHYNGDGISWQISHDVTIENCRSIDNAGLGLHPGSGSQRPVIRHNRMERNRLGLFFCWGVKFGLAEHNTIENNLTYGVSIGHCDTDNVVRENVIRNSGEVGILFRDDARGLDFWPHRNRIENNQITDSGGARGVGIDVRGKTRKVAILGNTIRETRKPMDRVGVRLGAATQQINVDQNQIEGFKSEIENLQKQPAP
jgi:hypothetical protein